MKNKIIIMLVTLLIFGITTVVSFGDTVDGSTEGTDSVTYSDAENSSVKATGELGMTIYYKLYEDGTLYITGSGEMTNFRYDNSPLRYRNDILKVIFQPTHRINNVGSNLFYYCNNLTSVEIVDKFYEMFADSNAESKIFFAVGVYFLFVFC